MSAPIPLRQDFDVSQLRSLARRTKDGPQARRLLALAAIYDGATRTEAAKIGGRGLQIIRDWLLRFNARGTDALLNGKSPGKPSKLNDLQRKAIAGMIENAPDPAVLQYRSDEPAPRGDRRGHCTRRPRCPLGRSGRLAHVDTSRRTGQHHHHRAATQMSRAQPG